MTYIPIVIVVALSIGIVVYMNIKRKQALSSFNADEEYKNAPVFINELMAEHFAQIKAQMKDKPVDAFTQCLPITNLKKQAAGVAVTAAKTVAWAAIGVKARYQTADHACYLVLSGTELHYLFFEEGSLKEHLVLDQYRMGQASIEKISTTDKVTRMGSAGGKTTAKLKLNIDDKPMEILFYDRVTRAPHDGGGIIRKDFYLIHAKYSIIGKYFTEQLHIKYPALALGHTLA